MIYVLKRRRVYCKGERGNSCYAFHSSRSLTLHIAALQDRYDLMCHVSSLVFVKKSDITQAGCTPRRLLLGYSAQSPILYLIQMETNKKWTLRTSPTT